MYWGADRQLETTERAELCSCRGNETWARLVLLCFMSMFV